MARIIDADEVALVIKQIANTRPNQTNPGGVYTSYTGQHCHVGQIMLGLNEPLPGRYEPVNSCGVLALERWLRARTGDSFTPAARDLMSRAQSMTDCGTPWGQVPARLGIA